MTGGRRSGSSSCPFGKSETTLLARPLEFILSEHLRHRDVCQAAEELAEARGFDADLARAIATFLKVDLAAHVRDEEQDLFPVLRRRLKPADGAERIIGLLSGEHSADESLSREVVEGLEAALAANVTELPTSLRNALLTFADRQRRHLTLENAIVLPLATRRLSSKDLDQIGRRMAARRGIEIRREAR